MLSRFASLKSRLALLGLASCVAASSVLAQGGPPDMPAITFPISTASIGTAIATAGATILFLVFGYKVGFRAVYALAAKVMSAALGRR